MRRMTLARELKEVKAEISALLPSYKELWANQDSPDWPEMQSRMRRLRDEERAAKALLTKGLEEEAVKDLELVDSLICGFKQTGEDHYRRQILAIRSAAERRYKRARHDIGSEVAAYDLANLTRQIMRPRGVR